MQFAIDIDDTLVDRLFNAMGRDDIVTATRIPATEKDVLDRIENWLLGHIVNHESTINAIQKRNDVTLEVEEKKRSREVR